MGEARARVEYRVEGRVAWLTLNRPGKLNALDYQAWRELREALTRAERDPGCGVVVLTGSGRAFCAGDDIEVFLSFRGADAAREFFMGYMLPALEAVVTSTKPVVAAVNGLAYGGGCELVLLSDIAVAAESATFCLPEALIGAWPTILVAVGSGRVGLKGAKALAMSCEPIDAATAQTIGLINRVAPAGALREEVDRTVRGILRGSPRAVAQVKRWMNRDLARDGIAALRASFEEFVATAIDSFDFREGCAAFKERRVPRFDGGEPGRDGTTAGRERA